MSPALPASVRLRLRRFEAGDEAALCALHQDERVRALLPDEQPLHEPLWAARFIEALQGFYARHPGLGIWHCSTAEPASFAGWFSLMPLGENAQALGAAADEPELGSRLLPSHWGSRLSLEGGELLLAHAFEQLAAPRVWGLCDPLHRSARFCLETLGFALRQRTVYEGRPAHAFALERAQWQLARRMPWRERMRRATLSNREGVQG